MSTPVEWTRVPQQNPRTGGQPALVRAQMHAHARGIAPEFVVACSGGPNVANANSSRSVHNPNPAANANDRALPMDDQPMALNETTDVGLSFVSASPAEVEEQSAQDQRQAEQTEEAVGWYVASAREHLVNYIVDALANYQNDTSRTVNLFRL